MDANHVPLAQNNISESYIVFSDDEEFMDVQEGPISFNAEPQVRVFSLN